MRLKPLALFALFALLLGSVAAAGFWFQQREAESDRLQALDQVVTVAEFKSALLGNWQRERMDDAVGIAQGALFVRAVRRFLADASSEDLEAARSGIQPSLREGKYDAFVLVAPQGRVLFTLGKEAPLPPDVKANMALVARTRQPYLAPVGFLDGHPVSLDLYAPVVEARSQAPLAGVLVMRLDPEDFLLPLARLWPVPWHSAETLLVERNDRAVRFVLPPNDAHASLMVPYDSATPAAMAARGEEGTYHGLDRRGMRVIAAVRQVAGTSWAIVTKVDAEEVEAPLRTRLWLSLTSASAVVLALFAGVLWLASREQSTLFRQMYEEARARQAIAGRLEAVSRLANDSIVLADASGRILDANDRAAETYGYAVEDFKTRQLRDLQAHDQAASMEAALKSSTVRDGVRFETLHARSDGSTFPVEVSARMVDIDGQPLVQLLLRDISGPQRAARQIRRLNQLLEMRSRINQAVVHLRQRDQLFTAACQAAVGSGAFSLAMACNWHEESRELELVTWRGHAPRDLEAGMRAHGDHALAGGAVGRAVRSGELAIANDIAAETASVASLAASVGVHAAAAVPVYEQGVVTAVFSVYSREQGFFDDRTERVLSEIGADLSFALEAIEADSRLRHAEARFRTLFEAAPFAVWAIERETGRIVAANEAASRQYGYTQDEFLAMPASGIFGPEDLQASPERGDHGHSFLLPLATRHRRKDGSMIDIELFCRAIDIDGRPAWFVAASDVTERKHLEEQFRQAHRMEAVGRLAGGIAHDFNNLLTAITGFAALSLTDVPDNAPFRGHIEQIARAAERAASLTRQLLAFSRRQVLQLQPLDLHACIADLTEMLRRLIGEDVRLTLELTGEPGIVEADRSQIDLVLLNLVVNARDAMPQGGTLTISTACVTVAPGGATKPGLPSQPGEYVCLSVRDTGTGMPPQVVARIFEPFFTTKPVGKGTGLGLSTVHGIVTQMGGHIAVASVPGEGTTFDVYLQRVTVSQPVGTREPRALAAARGYGTILLVEDDAGVRELAREVLQHGGYEVIEAPDALTALDLHASRPSPVDLVLTDIVMPGMSGIELTRQLSALHPDMSVMLMSGYPDDALERHGLGARPPDFLQKPFSPTVLLARVRQALDSKRPAKA